MRVHFLEDSDLGILFMVNFLLRSRKLKPIIVDPALYLTENSESFFATQNRPLPDAYRLFTGLYISVFCQFLDLLLSKNKVISETNKARE